MINLWFFDAAKKSTIDTHVSCEKQHSHTCGIDV